MTYAPDHALIATPIGMVRITGNDDHITGIATERPHGDPEVTGNTAVVRDCAAQLRAYFTGKLRHFDIPLSPSASVRGQALRAGIVSVRYGNMLSYGALARQLDSGPRAIGQACARNPFPIIVPCHRILAAGGRLGAYSGGEGPKTKRWLLDLEFRYTGKVLPWLA